MALNNDSDESFYDAELFCTANDNDLLDESPLLSDSARKSRTLNLKGALGSKREKLRDSFMKVKLDSVRRLGQNMSSRRLRRSIKVHHDDDDASMDSSLHSEGDARDDSIISLSSEIMPPPASTGDDDDFVFYSTAMSCEQFEPSLEFSIRSARTSSSHQRNSPIPGLDKSYDGRNSCSQFEPSLEFSVTSEPGGRVDHLIVNASSPATPKRVSKSRRKKSRSSNKSKSSDSKKTSKKDRKTEDEEQ